MGYIFNQLFTKPKVFSHIAGVSVEEFEQIVEKARPVWHTKVEKIKKVSGRPYGLRSLEGHVLCLLIYYRTYLTQEFLGFMFAADDSCICRSIRRTAKVLAPVLVIQKKRLVSEQEAKALLIDCTEHPIERPKKNPKKYYSGKKKRHTLKTEIQMTEDGKIIHISNPYRGNVHDMNIRKQGPPLHPDDTVYVDSGYQGLQQDHANTEYPYKRTKDKEQTT